MTIKLKKYIIKKRFSMTSNYIKKNVLKQLDFFEIMSVDTWIT